MCSFCIVILYICGDVGCYIWTAPSWLLCVARTLRAKAPDTLPLVRSPWPTHHKMLFASVACSAFVAPLSATTDSARSGGALRMNFFEKFLQEVDNFADDAMGRRLGNGAKFYGKRRSSFYGEDDELKKADPQQFDAEEDYSGPAGGSFFLLSEERDEQGRPMGFLTRKEARELKKQKEEERYQNEAETQAMTQSFGEALAASEE